MPRRSVSPAGRPAAAFSLLEMVLVLALLGLISTVTLGVGAGFLRGAERDDPESRTVDAIVRARRQAVTQEAIVALRYDRQARLWRWEGGELVLGEGGDVRLLPPVRVSAVLLGGREVETELERVRFYPDGTCDAFRVGVTQGGANRILRIDPWTGAVLAPEGGREPRP